MNISDDNRKLAEFFLNLEKQRGAQNTIKKFIVDDKETTDQTHILECIKEFCKTRTKNCDRN